MNSRLAKEGVWVRGRVNNIDSDTFVDTGAKYTIIDFDFWEKVNVGQDIVSTCICLVAAGGKNLPVVGESRIWLEIGNVKVHFPVVIMEQFKFDLLLGDDFLRQQSVVIDYGSKKLRIGCVEICFENLPSESVAVLGSVTKLPVGTPVRIRAELVGNHCGLALFGERQLVKTDERVMVAPVVTEADSNDSVLIELVNTTRSEVSLQPGTKLVQLQPFVSEVNIVNEDQAEKDAYAVPIEDLELSHLSDEQQVNLLRVLKKHHVWPMSDQLGTTRLVEHSIDVQEAQPVRQRPYRVPETKRQQIAKEVQKMLLANIIQPSASPWSSPVLLLEKPNGEFRFCVDYRRLNEKTKKDAYPLPRIDETLDALGNAAWFSTLNLQSGFWQIPMRAADMEKTAFATHNGHWEF